MTVVVVMGNYCGMLLLTIFVKLSQIADTLVVIMVMAHNYC